MSRTPIVMPPSPPMPRDPLESAGIPRPTARPPFSREQKTVIIYGILCVVLVLVVLQLWLLVATMNAYLGGDEGVIWPAAGASIVCFGLNVGLMKYLYAMDRRR